VYPTQLELAPVARPLVVGEQVGEGLLELQGDALAHDPDGVDGVHERVGVSLEKVALGVDHHRCHSPRSTCRV
jgi:hypothetical protein